MKSKYKGMIYDTMDIQQFRIAHSTVMEHYQFIERELGRNLCRFKRKSFYNGLMDVETFSISKVIRMVQEQEKINDIEIISDAEYETLKSICLRRNFWTHNCYTGMVFDIKTGGPKKQTDITQLYDDIRNAEQMRDLLFNRKIELLHNLRDNGTLW